MAMGTKAIYCGEMGQGSIMKLIGNTLISFMLEGLCEGLVVGGKAGLAVETMLEVDHGLWLLLALLLRSRAGPSRGATSTSTSRSTCW